MQLEPVDERQRHVLLEFHKLRAEGCPVGALAMICVDNPMAAATGHRICNDCMKSCIYQKQDPVDIPQSETRLLKDVLALPWGFEIYSLLTRWNPLNLRRPVPAARSGKRVLVVGQGARRIHLGASPPSMMATRVVGDRRPQDRAAGPALSGITLAGERVPFSPIRDVQTLYRSARRPCDGRFRRGGRIWHHRSVGQEFPEDDPYAARTTRPLCALWRRAFRRHARRRRVPSRSVSTTSRWPPAPGSRRCSTCPTDSPMACARPPTS